MPKPIPCAAAGSGLSIRAAQPASIARIRVPSHPLAGVRLTHMGDSGGAGRVAYLDGLRTVAIVAVLGVHWGRAFFGTVQGGYVGVDVFFVLSGFIVTTIIWKKRETRSYSQFIRGRVRRLYPALVGVVAAVVGLAFLLPGVSAPDAAVSGALALSQANSVLLGLGIYHPVSLGITWSLSAEWIFYLIWPVLLLSGQRFGARALAIVALAAAIALYVGSLWGSGDWFYFGPVARGGQMMAGAWLALAIVTWKPGVRIGQAFRLLGPACLIAVLWWVFYGALESADIYRLVGFPLVTAATLGLIVSGLAAPSSGMIELLSARWIAALGRGSYSIYLWHTVPIAMIAGVGATWSMEWKWAFLIGVTAGTSWLSYRFLEKPYLKRQSLLATTPGHARSTVMARLG